MDTTTNELYENPAEELVEIEEKNANNAAKDPDYEPEIEMESEEANKNTEIKRKKRQKMMVRTEDWENNRAKIKREMGQDYNGRKKIDGVWKYDVQKEKRKMKERCNCKASLKGKSLHCRTFSDEERIAIFNHFWSDMGWKERKVYTSFLIDSIPTKRSRNRVSECVSMRSESLIYHLKLNGERKRVCKQMFLNTHGVKENMILDWLKSRMKSKIKKSK